MSKRISKNYNSLLLEHLAERPIVHNVALVRLSGSTIAGLFLSQLLYWWGKGESSWIWKTIPEFQEETGMNRSEQDRAIRRWKELGILQLVNRGIPRRRYFYINTKLLEEKLKEAKRNNTPKTAGQSAESSRLYSRDLQTTTESTQESTSRDNVLQTLRRPETFDINAAREGLAKKFSMKENKPKI